MGTLNLAYDMKIALGGTVDLQPYAELTQWCRKAKAWQH